MPTTIQPSFTGGELAPSLYSRVDLARYATGLRTCRNFVVQRHGGVANRPGTRFIGEAKDSARRHRLVPFVFSADQAYVLEFGHNTLRFIRDGAYLTAVGAATWLVGTTYNVDQYVTHLGVLYRSLQNGNTGNTPASSPLFWQVWAATTPIELATVYTESDLPRLAWAQSADVMTLVHPGRSPQELQRFSDTDWRFGQAFGTVGPAIPGTITPTAFDASTPTKAHQYFVATVDASGVESISPFTGGSYPSVTCNLQTDKPVTVTWSAVAGASRYNIYRGRNGVLGYIGSSETTSFLDENIVPDYSDGPRLPGSVSPLFTTPAAIAYFQQRLMYGGPPASPQTIFGTRVGDFGDIATQQQNIRDDDPVEYTIAAQQVNQIRHLVPLQNLVVLTDGGEFLVRGTNDGILTPSSVLISPQGYRGSSWARPVVVGNAVLFVQRDGSKLRDLFYRFETDGFDGADLTVFSSHLVDGRTLDEVAYQQSPNSCVWAVRDDGVLLGLTYMRDQEVVAWHRHDTDGAVESITCIPEGREDAVYLVVRRTIAGATRRYVERMQARVTSPVRDAWFVDSGLAFDGAANLPHPTITITGGVTWAAGETLTVTGSATGWASTDVGDVIVLRDAAGVPRCRLTIVGFTSSSVVTVQPDRTVPADVRGVATGVYAMARDTFAGLGHLEGKTLAILADGNVAPSAVVTGGQVTLATPAVRVIAGLPYTAEIETLDLQIPNAGVMRDRPKVVPRVTVYVQSSRGWSVGTVPGDVLEVKERATEGYDDPILPYTDAREVRTPGTWEYPGRVIVRQTNPLPCTVLAIMPDVTVGG